MSADEAAPRLNTIEQAMEKYKLDPPENWVLIAPNNMTWSTPDPMELIRVLATAALAPASKLPETTGLAVDNGGKSAHITLGNVSAGPDGVTWGGGGSGEPGPRTFGGGYRRVGEEGGWVATKEKPPEN